MNLWENTVLTDQGKALQAKLMKGQTLKIKRVTTGAGKVPVVDLRQQTSVTEGGYDITLQPARTEGDSTILSVLLENRGLEKSYELWQVGFYAEDPDEGEILFCLAQASETKNIPSEAESPGFSITWDFYFNTSNTVPFEMVLNSAGLVNIEAYQVHTEAIQKTNSKINSLNSALDNTVSNLNKMQESLPCKNLPTNKKIIDSLDQNKGNFIFYINSYDNYGGCDVPGKENYYGIVFAAGERYSQVVCVGNLNGGLYTRVKINGSWSGWFAK